MTDQPNRPDFIAYTVIERAEGQSSRWTKCGVAYAHKNGEGYNIMLDALPVNGKLVLQPPKEQDDA